MGDMGPVHLGSAPASGGSVLQGNLTLLVLLWRVRSQVLACYWDLKNEKWHSGEKLVSKNGRLEKWPFYSATASDFIMVKFIKVISSLKSHQEKQIWTY